MTIYHGDWQRVLDLPELPEFTAVVTDPPYGIALSRPVGYRKGHDPIVGDDEAFDPSPILEMGLPTIMWGANNYCDRLPPTSGWLVWNKVLYDGAAGTMAMNGKRQAEAELAWTNFLRRTRGYRHLWDGIYRDSESGTRYHPAQKPVSLMSWCLQLLPGSCDVIFDPYMGCGPTLRAAKDLGLKAIGCEIEERYCAIAAERMGQESLFSGVA